MVGRWAARGSLAVLAVVVVTMAAVGSDRGGPGGSPVMSAEPTPGPLVPGNWTMVFHDEFAAAGVAAHWNRCFWWNRAGCTTYGDQEEQWYLPGQTTVADGVLRITAEPASVMGADRAGNARAFRYRSGVVTTDEHFEFRYGLVEVRAKLPPGNGIWPALWLLASDRARQEEIDIVELWGRRPRDATFSLHPPAPLPRRGWSYVDSTQSWAGQWHTYGVLWEPGSVVWFIDGIERARHVESVSDVAMYLIMNVAVGGTFGGSPDATTPWPAVMEVDSVRVWQHR